jgi:GNAT superfamily N-acetyltransferase
MTKTGNVLWQSRPHRPHCWSPSRTPLARGRFSVAAATPRSCAQIPCRTFPLGTHTKRGREVERKEVAWRILTRYPEVAPFVEATINAADSDKEALGFYAASVYQEFARKEQLFVAVEVGERCEYAGHLFFNARYPTAHVRQIFVVERHRGHGLGALLLDELKMHLTELQFISIRARVREDLRGANAFWEGQRFYTQRLAPGGSARKKQIVERSHELSTPQLFASSGINQANPFGLRFASPSETPLYLLDLNVLFDLGRRRHRHEDVVAVFRAERMQACQLALSSEIDAELARTASPGKTDSMVDLTSILPKFDRPVGTDGERLERELAAMVFPERHVAGALRPNDLSDVRHLATAIFHGLHGLITSDGSVLDAAVELRERFCIEVLSPAAFTLDDEVKANAGTHGTAPESILVLEELQAGAEGDVGRRQRSGVRSMATIAFAIDTWFESTRRSSATWSGRTPSAGLQLMPG